MINHYKLLAQGSITVSQNNCQNGSICNPLNVTNLTDFLTKILQGVIEIGAVAVVFFVIYSGFLFVTAQGNETKLEKAKKTFLYTMIGAAVLLGAVTIATLISTTIKEIAA